MADPLFSPQGVQPFTPAHLPFENGEDSRLNADFLLAYGCLGNEADASQAVIKALQQLDTTMAAQADNRRPRYIAEMPRASYRPFIEEGLTRRRLLLNAIRNTQVAREAVAGKIDSTMAIPWLSLEMVLAVLHHTPFHAAVGMSRVLAGYTGAQTLQIYDRVASSMPEQTCKTPTEICRIEDLFSELLIDRFKGRIKISPKSPKRFQRIKPSQQQLAELRLWIPYFLPKVSSSKNVLVPIKSEGMDKMKLVNDLLSIDRFNELVKEEGIPPFEERASIPLITSSHPSDPDPDPNSSKTVPNTTYRFGNSTCDVERIKQALDDARQQRLRMRPTSLLIYIDDVLRGELPSADASCSLELGRSARVLVIAARDQDGSEIPIATHVLVHDHAKDEKWEVMASGMGTVQCALQFRLDGSIRAAFVFTERANAALVALIDDKVLSHTSNAHTLDTLSQIVCMPHIALNTLASMNSSRVYFAFFTKPVKSPDPCHSAALVGLRDLDQQIEVAIKTGGANVSENVQRFVEAYMLVKWLWAEGTETAMLKQEHALLSRDANHFLNSIRATLHHLGQMAGSGSAELKAKQNSGQAGASSPSLGKVFNLPGAPKQIQKIKPNQA